MKKIFWITGLLVLLVSCAKEQEIPEVVPDEETTTVIFSASLPETKVYLGEKDGDSYPTLWQAGDVIYVNGYQSVALQENDGYVGTNHAEFSVTGTLQAPYCSAYPASAVSNYSSGSATVTIPTQQTYVAGQHDPAAYLMVGSGNSPSLSFNPQVALFKITPTAPAEGTLMITSIRLEAIGGEKMSGAFTTDFTALSGGENNYVEIAAPQGGLPFGTTFTFAFPAGTYASGLRFIINASDDTSMSFSRTSSFTAAAGTLYPLTAPAYVPSAVTINGHWSINSSAITLRWNCSNPATRTKKPWKIHVYTDEQCANEVETYDLPAGDTWVVGDHNRFVIAGLSQGTTYWFRVEDVIAGALSDPVSESTKQFTVVPMPVSDITSPGLVFAEDFSEYAWGNEYLRNGKGYRPSDMSSFSNHSMTDATLSPSELDFRSNSISTAIASSRLADWLSEQSVYIHPGYMKLGATGKAGFVLTPAFQIESGKAALADVTLSISRYDASQDETWALCVVSNDGYKGDRESDFSWPNVNDPTLYRLVSTTKKMSDSSPWDQITVSGLCLQRGNKLAFGRVKGGNNDGARVLLSDISVEVKALSSSSLFAYPASGITSSTIPFTWNGDPSHAFTATLYSDAACTSQVASFSIPANDACWDGKQPKYVFGGLTPGTTYYLKVTDTTDNVESNVASATTEAFTIVQMPASITSTGVALAEDFGELLWHTDRVAGAAGFIPSSTTSFSDRTAASFVKSGNDNPEKQMGASATNSALASSRLANWAYDSSVWYHCGYLKLGKSAGKGWILTPQFTVPDGKKAIVKVTITAAKFDSSQENNWGVAVLNPEETNMTGTYSASFDWPAGGTSDKYREVNLGTDWTTVTVENLAVLPGDRIAFGARNGASSSKSRVFISDIQVEVTALENVPIRVSILERTSSTLSFTWNEGGAANTDNQIAYTATLYSDAECTSPVLSYSFPSGSSGQAIWRSGKYPKFIFSGLDPNTTYFLKVVDGASQVSEVIAAKTLSFTVVTMPSSITETGVVLAEDFSELCWDFDYLGGYVGVTAPSSPSVFSDIGSGFVKYSESTGSYELFSYTSALGASRLNNWLYDAGSSSKIHVHPGHITLGSLTNGQKAWILTPAFTVPSGKEATIEVTITAARGYNESSSKKAETKYAIGVLANKSGNGGYAGGSANISNNICDFGWMSSSDRSSIVYNTFTVSDSWKSFTFTMIVSADDRIIVGAAASEDSNYNSNTKKCCLNLSDIKVNVTEIKDKGEETTINVGNSSME